jgi:SAM-dependent methyltransferase
MGHVERNERMWDAQADSYQERHGPQLESAGGDAWGLWQIPESELRVLGDVAARDVLELGCGAAQWSIALHGRGARVVGLDLSTRQLEHARQAMNAARVEFPLVHSGAEATPFPDGSFDIVFCDHGAMTFASLHAMEFADEPTVFQLPYGTWIQLFAENDLVVEDLIELRPAADAISSYRSEADREWACRWPMEHIWRVRKRGPAGV